MQANNHFLPTFYVEIKSIFLVAFGLNLHYYQCRCYGRMAELVDALVSGTSGSDTLEVRVFLCPPEVFRGCSSADRALRSHRRGRGFESHQLHQKSKSSGIWRNGRR